MGKLADFRSLHEENSSEIPAQWIYWSINVAFKLLSTSQIALHMCKPVIWDYFNINKVCKLIIPHEGTNLQ